MFPVAVYEYGNLESAYQFTCGEITRQAVEKVNLLRKLLNGPTIDVNGAKLEVQGKILKTD